MVATPKLSKSLHLLITLQITGEKDHAITCKMDQVKQSSKVAPIKQKKKEEKAYHQAKHQLECMAVKLARVSCKSLVPWKVWFSFLATVFCSL